MSDEIFIAGASVRSAAQSALRAGWQVAAADLFCDRDLPWECRAHRVDDYPRGILDIAARVSPRAWSYTGGLENDPDLVDAISRRHVLLGNSGGTLRRVRDPWQLQQAFARQRIAYPEVLAEPPCRQVGQWLQKPLRGSGGTHIGVWQRPVSAAGGGDTWNDRERAPHEPTKGTREVLQYRGAGFYYQRRADGVAHGAVFVGAQGTATLLGVTRQLVGSAWAGARGFRYVGSIGPLDLGPRRTAELRRIGECLAGEFSLRGLFGVDVMIAGARIAVIEVNPRFTASIEILERATGMIAMAFHRSACRGTPLPELRGACGQQLHGKAIVYARGPGVVTAEFYKALEKEPCEAFPCFADLPREGTRVSAGHPILTAFSQGDQVRQVLGQLRVRARAVQRYLA